jgi:GTPase
LAKDKVEMLVNEQVETAIRYSQVVCIMIDAMEAFTGLDMSIISRILEEGRAVVLIANKWDLMEDKYKKKAINWIEKQLEKGLGQSKGIPIVYISAKAGIRVDNVMGEVMRVYEKWNSRVTTAMLNQWMFEFGRT